MAFRYLIYSTGTTYAETIVRESATNNPGVNEASLYSDFIIPEIQPLYLWRVTGGTTVVPNTDANINAYLDSIAPAPEPEDDATVGYVTGLTSQKIDKVTGADGNLGTFNAEGNLDDSGYEISDLTGVTYNFVGSGGTQVFESGTNPRTITVYSTDPTGATVTWGNIVGTVSDQTDLWNILTAMTGETANKLDTSVFNQYTGDTATELGNKLDITDFDTYSGTTSILIGTKLDESTFNSYTGTSQPILVSALTGVTNLGTGTTLGDVSGRNVTFKSVSVLGGLQLSGDANNLIISGETNAAAVWGNITGTLSNQTDLWAELTGKTDVSLFNQYTGDTATALTNIENDITYLSGQTDTKLNITDFDIYSGATSTRIGDIEDDITVLYNESLVNITGGTNGISKASAKVLKLGGGLTEDTLLSGSTFSFDVDVKDISLKAAGGNGIGIEDNSGNGITIESDGGSVELIGNTGLGAETTKITINDTQMLITDSRGTPVGLQYAGDYGANFTARSLVDKGYADAIVSGLDLKESVKAATYSGDTDIDLLGGTFGGTIDGYTVQDGDRILVKNQDSAKEDNGIWVYSSGGNNFGRAIDFTNPNVTSGAFTFIETGNTNASSGWVLVTQDPINIGTTELSFTKFSEAGSFVGGTGIDISGNVINVDGTSLAGNSITWSANTFNVNTETGTLSTALGTKLNISDFNTYSGSTATALSGIEDDITYLSGQTDTKLNITDFDTYSGATANVISGIEDDIAYVSGITDTKLDESVFNAYTGSTAPMRLFLTHTGGTELNTVAATAIEWDTVNYSGTSFLWSGGTDIWIKEAGDYELSYNIPYNAQGAQSMAIGGNVILNNASVIDLTAAAGFSTDTNAAGNLALPPIMLTFALNDKLTLAAFRTGRSGSTTSSPTGSILIKKLNTLQ